MLDLMMSQPFDACFPYTQDQNLIFIMPLTKDTSHKLHISPQRFFGYVFILTYIWLVDYNPNLHIS